jgi:hypothetical protein
LFVVSPERLVSWLMSAVAACPLKAKEDEKSEHYADTPHAWKFYPCGHGTQADMGPASVTRGVSIV